MFYEVIPTKIFRASNSSGVLTYSSDPEHPLTPGQIVEIPLGKSSTIGIVLKRVPEPDFNCKPVIRVIYNTPLPAHLLRAIVWLSKYYLAPLPTAANLVIPKNLTRNRRKSVNFAHTAYVPSKIELNPAQKIALEALQSLSTSTKLLHGITGSGKTNIYLTLAQDALQANKSVILLVPEIALTSQLVQVFETTFGSNTTVIHSKQTESERHQIWQHLLESQSPQVIIGARSALFAPIRNLGLIIIDESHESSYFQENSPKYSALRLASFIASSSNGAITCIQGSATPLIADYYLAKHNNAVVSLSERAKTQAIHPDVHIVDLKNRSFFNKNRYFSTPLLNTIKQNLANHHQTLIFHNRRGSSPLTICENCGWQAVCPHCYLPLTLHTDSYKLICHTCGYDIPVPHSCPDCKHPDLIHKGFGTKLLESELHKLFPSAKIVRFDADNGKSTSLDALYSQVKSGDFDIIVGTQSIAKGLDLPLLATVGVVQADSGLSLPDYAAEERTFQLITQVVGRVGRGHLSHANAFIQTYQPDHPAIIHALNPDPMQGYHDFYSHATRSRQRGFLPPYSYLARLSFTYKTESVAFKHASSYYKILSDCNHIETSIPTPLFHERSSDGYTWQLLLRSSARSALLSAIDSLPANTGLHFTIDPPSLL